MLIIDESKQAALADLSLVTYVEELIGHVREFAPEVCHTLGDGELRPAVRHGVELAAAHGFHQRGPARLHVELMLLFGAGFVDDPQYPWADALREGRRFELAMDRADDLYTRVDRWVHDVGGPDDARSLAAHAELARRLAQGLEFSHGRLDEELLALLRDVHPHKAAAVGEDRLRALIGVARARARVHGFESPRAHALMAVLMYNFGHRCDADPFLPWISRALVRGNLTPERVAERLERRARTWLSVRLHGQTGAGAR